MVRVKKTPGYKLAARTYAPGSGLHSDHLRNRLTAGKSASVLAAVKMLWGGSEGTYPSLH
jgi:hypothetical protein